MQEELFQFHKPGEMKVTHLNAWLNLIQSRQDQFLRHEVDHIFHFASINAEGLVSKPAQYDADFIRKYALEHGPKYRPLPSHVSSSSPQLASDLQIHTPQPVKRHNGNLQNRGPRQNSPVGRLGVFPGQEQNETDISDTQAGMVQDLTSDICGKSQEVFHVEPDIDKIVPNEDILNEANHGGTTLSTADSHTQNNQPTETTNVRRFVFLSNCILPS